MDSVKRNAHKILLSNSLEIALKSPINLMMCHRSAVGTRTSHGLDGPDFEFRQWQNRPDRLWGSLSVQWVSVFFLGVELPGREVNRSPQSSTRLGMSGAALSRPFYFFMT